jgi:hypothetical protein
MYTTQNPGKDGISFTLFSPFNPAPLPAPSEHQYNSANHKTTYTTIVTTTTLHSHPVAMFPSVPRTLLRASALPRAAVLARPVALGMSFSYHPYPTHPPSNTIYFAFTLGMASC